MTVPNMPDHSPCVLWRGIEPGHFKRFGFLIFGDQSRQKSLLNDRVYKHEV